MAQAQVQEPRTVVKDAGNARLYSDGTILIRNVRASYPHVFHPYKGKDSDGDGKFGIVGLMPKTADYFPAKNLIRDHIRRMIEEQKLKDLPATNKFLRDGDLTAREEYEGMYTINASEVRRPVARDSKRDPKTGKPKILKVGEDEDRIYAGCWVNILIRPWWQNNKFGKKVNAGLVAVQFVDDDEAFGQGRISEEDVDETFGEFADEDSGFDDDGEGDL